MTLRQSRSFLGAVAQARSQAEKPFPFMVEAAGRESLTDYIASAKPMIERLLVEHGAILFRGFAVSEATDFSAALAQLEPNILTYTERSSPRTAVAEKVYTSTDHPAHQKIAMHSEQSYTLNWPCLISFFCRKKAASGGNTPIADNRKILSALSEPLRSKFLEYGVMYRRVYTPGLGIDWRTAFQTEDKATVEAFCESRGISLTWEDDDRLRTTQLRSAFQKHPVTGELVWFNHALFFHVTSLEPGLAEALIDAVGLQNVPTNTCFGNGEAFSADDLALLRGAVDEATVEFDWQGGDILLLDNMLSQHGRDSFTGEREVLTLMAGPYADRAAPLRAPHQG
ncbi:TauD/TfdA family dioxygenase [Alkalilimnicola ehrlichii]|nr:TauD/TfdA family dioxygenase [Alkalilimnicola ehrlichii]